MGGGADISLFLLHSQLAWRNSILNRIVSYLFFSVITEKH